MHERWAFPPDLAGLFLGGTIHDVAQVVGAGYTIDHKTGDYATIVKLFRVSMLAVVVVVVSTMFKTAREAAEAEEGGAGASKQALVPWFLWVFVAMVVLNSIGWVPVEVQKGLSDVSRLCLVVAIAALGVKTSFQKLAQAGWKPFTLLVVETVWMAAFVLAAIYLRNQ